MTWAAEILVACRGYLANKKLPPPRTLQYGLYCGHRGMGSFLSARYPCSPALHGMAVRVFRVDMVDMWHVSVEFEPGNSPASRYRRAQIDQDTAGVQPPFRLYHSRDNIVLPEIQFNFSKRRLFVSVWRSLQKLMPNEVGAIRLNAWRDETPHFLMRWRLLPRAVQSVPTTE